MGGRNVSLTPRLDRFVDSQVETGRHRNASEVVREALRRYEEEIAAERQLLDVLGSMIERSDANMAACRYEEAGTDEELQALVAGIGERASARLKAEWLNAGSSASTPTRSMPWRKSWSGAKRSSMKSVGCAIRP